MIHDEFYWISQINKASVVSNSREKLLDEATAKLAARGIVNRSRADIVECLTMHPLVNSYSIATDLADKYIELNKDFIDGWK